MKFQWLVNLLIIKCCFANLNIDLDSILGKENFLIKLNNKYFIALPDHMGTTIKNHVIHNEIQILNFDKFYFNADNIKANKDIIIDYQNENKNIKVNEFKKEEEKENENQDVNVWMNISIIAALTIFGGLMSGLTVGYLSIDDLEVELKSINGTENDKKNAEKVLPILAKRHWLLVSLLLMNSVAQEALPLFLNVLVPEYLAVIISVSLVLLFGEIIPQAICTGPRQINIAAFLSPVTRLIMYCTCFVSYPIAKLLDYCFGEHMKSRFQNTDLKTLIELHTHNALAQLENKEALASQNQPGSAEGELIGLNQEQANLIISAIDIRKKSAKDLMISYSKAFMLDLEKPLGENEICEILEKGFSRIPVFSGSKNNLIGLVRLKQLVGKDFSVPKSLKDFNLKLQMPLVISPDLKVIDLLREFIKGKSHMAVVTKDVEMLQHKLGFGNTNFFGDGLHKEIKWEHESIIIEGIVTLEDVIEGMINMQILDEDDYEKKFGDKGVLGRMKTIAHTKRLDSKLLARDFISAESERIRNIIKDSYNNNRMSYRDNAFSREVQMNHNESDDRSHRLIQRDENENNKNYIV